MDTLGARRFWGWGIEGAGPSRPQQAKMAETIAQRFGRVAGTDGSSDDRRDRPARPRVVVPDSLAAMCTVDREERVGHTYGKSFRDVWRGLHRDFSHPPDVVASPRDEHDITSLLDWCSEGRGSRRFPTVAVHRWSAVSSATSTTTTPARSVSTCGLSTRSSRSTPNPAPLAFRLVSTALRSRISSVRTG